MVGAGSELHCDLTLDDVTGTWSWASRVPCQSKVLQSHNTPIWADHSCWSAHFGWPVGTQQFGRAGWSWYGSPKVFNYVKKSIVTRLVINSEVNILYRNSRKNHIHICGNDLVFSQKE